MDNRINISIDNYQFYNYLLPHLFQHRKETSIFKNILTNYGKT